MNRDAGNCQRARRVSEKRVRITPPNQVLSAVWTGSTTSDTWNAAHGWSQEKTAVSSVTRAMLGPMTTAAMAA
jgi:hypothetical protein